MSKSLFFKTTYIIRFICIRIIFISEVIRSYCSFPPIFIFNPGKNRKPKNIADFHHNPLHAKVLKERADSLKIKNVVYAPRIGIIDKSGQGVVDFITENLN